MSIVFLDTEFTDLLHPRLLSLGLVTLDGRVHHVELDLSSEVGRARLRASSDFVRFNGVLDTMGCVPSAQCTGWDMGSSHWRVTVRGCSVERAACERRL